jgi:hypothetical protein
VPLNVDDLQADCKSELNRLEMMDMLLELGTPRTPAANNAVSKQIIGQIE